MNKFHRTRSQLQERRVAAELGGHTQAGSGSMPGAKGDVRVNGDVRVECKTTTKKDYILKLETIRKIKAEGMAQGFEDWAIQLEFKTQGTKIQFAIMDKYLAADRGVKFYDGGLLQTPYASINLSRVYLQIRPSTSVVFDTGTAEHPALTGVVIIPWAHYLELRGKK